MVRCALAGQSNGAVLIGEHEVSSGFHSFWGELLPLLTPACVTIFNRSYGQYLDGYRPVDRELGITTADLTEPDMLAEAAFEVFRTACGQGIQTRDTIEDLAMFDRAWRTAQESIALHRFGAANAPPLRESVDHRYLLALGRRYEALGEMFPNLELEFFPTLKGCGVLGSRQADLAAGRTLVEVKTVDRNFSSKDIKQVIVYLALDHLSGDRRWELVTFFNPRKSFQATFDPKRFLSYISAGRSAGDVYREVEKLLLHRDFNIEHRF
jgi:hypothetical protein